jgi:DNA-binding XRE family transcriptional regulator
VANINSVRQIREAKMMSKAELARKADVTVQTIDRIEKGNECRLDTKRKIILALGYKLADRTRIFEDENDSPPELPKKLSRKRAN